MDDFDVDVDVDKRGLLFELVRVDADELVVLDEKEGSSPKDDPSEHVCWNDFMTCS